MVNYQIDIKKNTDNLILNLLFINMRRKNKIRDINFAIYVNKTLIKKS